MQSLKQRMMRANW